MIRRRSWSHLNVKAPKLESWANVCSCAVSQSYRNVSRGNCWQSQLDGSAGQPGACDDGVSECLCVRMCCSPCTCVLCGSFFRQLLRNLPNNDKAWYESPGTKGQRRWQKMWLRHSILEAGVWGRRKPHSSLPGQ